MKTIPIEEYDQDTAKMVVEDVFGSKIWRIGSDQYAIQPHLMPVPVCIFESTKFSAFLEQHCRDILFLTVTKVVCRMCPCETRMMQIRMLLEGGRIAYVEPNDTYVIGDLFDPIGENHSDDASLTE